MTQQIFNVPRRLQVALCSLNEDSVSSCSVVKLVYKLDDWNIRFPLEGIATTKKRFHRPRGFSIEGHI